MKAQPARMLAALALAGAGAILLLAAEPEFGTAVYLGSPNPWVQRIASRWGAGAAVLLYAAAGAGIAALLWAFVHPRRRRREPELIRVIEQPRTPWWAYALVAAVLLGSFLTGYELLSNRGGGDSGPLPAQPPPEVSEAVREAGGRTAQPGQVAGAGSMVASRGAHGIIVAAILLGAAALPAFARLRRRAGEVSGSGGASTAAPVVPPASAPDRSTMDAAESERLIEAIASADDPREAVLAAFHLLEAIADGFGQRRQPSQTPAEYLAVGSPPVIRETAEAGRLVQLYCKAAYSSEPVGPSDRAEAVKAVRRLWELLRQGQTR